MFIMLYCNRGSQIVYSVLALCIHFFITCTVAYLQEPTVSYIVTNAVLILVAGGLMCLVGMLSIYVMELQSRLFTSNVENLKLLDGMHEGLLILSDKNHES